jgi:hypothetical protein
MLVHSCTSCAALQNRLGPQARSSSFDKQLAQTKTYQWRRSHRASRDTASPVDTSAAARRQLRRSGAHVTLRLTGPAARTVGQLGGGVGRSDDDDHTGCRLDLVQSRTQARACTAALTPSRSRNKEASGRTVDGTPQLAARVRVGTGVTRRPAGGYLFPPPWICLRRPTSLRL